jgi:hypothetical protein
MSPGGLVLIALGVLIVCQVAGGDAINRLNLFGA